MTGLDCNALIQLAFLSHPQHAATQRLLEAEVAAGNQLVLASIIAAEFLHVCSDPRRFATPLLMNDAVDWLRDFIRDNAVRVLEGDASTLETTLKWLKQHRLGRKRIIDTHLAAVLQGAGVRRLITSNPSDFKVFGVFELATP